MRSVAISCAGIDLDGEVFNGIPFSFQDLEENVCGCPAIDQPCVATTSSIDAPLGLDTATTPP
jgi:hypothetical protein